MNQYYVYIMSNKSKTLYTGVTNDLQRRIYEHKQKLIPGFTQKYNITKLVYYEETPDIQVAIEREKQIKGWLRSKKIWLLRLFYGELILKCQFNKLRNLKLLKLRNPYPSLLINLSLLLIPSTVPLVVLPSK
ncbi:excinuclease ABC, C subunit, N-terminal [Anabaena cylindrica PCC 7122]|nr:excinuclease ABC, C subunit, N-terminal [Anabaena cylindrica PCC 7122]